MPEDSFIAYRASRQSARQPCNFLCAILLIFTIIRSSEAAIPPQIGLKKILVLPVEFPDLPDAAPSRPTILNALEGSRRFFESNSYGMLSITSTVTSALRMPQLSINYTAGFNVSGLRADALAAARAVGINPDEFDYDIVVFGQAGFPFLGWGTFGTKGLWIQEYVGFPLHASTICHELGHNFGLGHADAWLSPSTIGAGTKIEGGNPFDVMGGGHAFPASHFNSSFKHDLGWLPTNSLHRVSKSGIYRIYAQDAGTKELSRKYVITIEAGVETPGNAVDYWVEFRQNFGEPNGQVLVFWRGADSTARTYLLDTTPGSADFWDGAISIGRSFTDSNRRVTIAPVASGGRGADWYFDIEVTLESTLIPPRILMQPHGLSVAAGANVDFSVTGESSSPITFNWRRHGTPIQGNNSGTLSFSQITHTDGGEYSVVLSNALGSVVSSVAMIVVTNLPPSECQGIPPGLISWWTGDYPLDVVGSNHVQIAVPSYASGVVGNAFLCDSRQAAPKAPNSALWGMGLEDFTIELWVNFLSVPANAIFLTQDNGPGNIDKWIFWWNDSRLRFYVANTGQPVENIGNGTFSPQTNQWYHVAVTRSSDSWRFYLNGVLLSTDVTSVSLPRPTAPLEFFGDASFSGRMDDIRIYGRGLRPDEILNSYRAGSIGLCVPASAPTFLEPIAATARVDEGGTAKITIKRMGHLSSLVSVRCTTLEGSAREGINFQNVATNLTLFPQEMEKDIFITTLDDGAPGHKDFSVALSNPSAGAVVSSVTAKITIVDNGCAPPPQGLVGWWNAEARMNSLIGSEQIILKNGASVGNGKSGSGFRFDGVDDYVEVNDPRNFSFGPTTPMSVSLWAYRTGHTGHIIGKRVACTGGNINWQIGFNDNAFVFGGDNPLWSGQAMPLNKWVHITATFDGVTLRFYFDGRIIGSQSGRLGETNSAPLRIGGAGDCEPFAGSLDEIAIFDRALNPAEIEAIFLADSKGMCPPSPPGPIQFVRVRRATSGQMQLTVRGNPGRTVSLQYSTNLFNWEILQTSTFNDYLVDFFHHPGTSGVEFYRSVDE